MNLYGVSFFFQAEDGIRDYKVTGVQTCALPIYVIAAHTRDPAFLEPPKNLRIQIGRASCREKSVDLGGRRIIKKKKKKQLTQKKTASSALTARRCDSRA